MRDGGLVENLPRIFAAEPLGEVVIFHFLGRWPKIAAGHAFGDRGGANFGLALRRFVETEQCDLGVIGIAGQEEVSGGDSFLGVVGPDLGSEAVVERELQIDPGFVDRAAATIRASDRGFG